VLIDGISNILTIVLLYDFYTLFINFFVVKNVWKNVWNEKYRCEDFQYEAAVFSGFFNLNNKNNVITMPRYCIVARQRCVKRNTPALHRESFVCIFEAGRAICQAPDRKHLLCDERGAHSLQILSPVNWIGP